MAILSELPDQQERVEDARDLTLALVQERAPLGTVCPSEVARALAASSTAGGPAAWRDLMPTVHAAVDQLVGEGRVQLSWKGQRLAGRVGPYRIGGKITD